jgi:hypothetical protein
MLTAVGRRRTGARGRFDDDKVFVLCDGQADLAWAGGAAGEAVVDATAILRLSTSGLVDAAGAV